MCLTETRLFAQEFIANLRQKVKCAETQEERRAALLRLDEAEVEYQRLSLHHEADECLADS